MNVVVGVMARAPTPGQCKTRLAASVGAERAAALYASMLLDTLAGLERACEGARLVVLAAPESDGMTALRHITPPRWELVEQRGDGLGRRLANSLADLAASAPPHAAIALVASDSPTAPWDDAGRALAELAERPERALMGPADDGGYWLIAQTEARAALFEHIRWSTSHVADETRERCRALGLSLAELPSALDVDDAEDLERLRNALGARPECAPCTAALLASS